MMSQQGSRMLRTLCLAFLVASVLPPTDAVADPVKVSGFLDGQLRGAQVQEQLTLTFPGFNVVLVDATHLIPGFCIECSSGEPVPFAQRTGAFSGQSFADSPTVSADVRGDLSFVGPTDTLVISHDPFDSAFFSEPVHWSGSLTVRQPNRVLFNGTLSGTGIGSAVYENTPLGETRIGGYQFEFTGVATTPEPASIALLGTVVAWMAIRRRRMV